MKYLIIISIIVSLYSCKNAVSENTESIQDIAPITDCSLNDKQVPIMNGSISLSNEATVTTTPEINFDSARDNCKLSHYEVAIGKSAGSEDVLNYRNIGLSVSETLSNLSLKYSDVYFISVRAVDSAGNISSAITSSSFQVFTPKSLTGLVLWLDASDLESIKDNEDDDGTSQDFSGDVKNWEDVSQSSFGHTFTSIGISFPEFDPVSRGMKFSGSQELMATLNHTDINTSIVGQRTILVNFKTSDNILSRQVLYEEGGTVRGLNIYIDAGKIRCGFWNDRDDGDGIQPYIDVEEGISTATKYSVIMRYDYSHFSGASGTDGSVECFLNGQTMGNVNTTSRLHPHSGDIGLGGVNQQTYFHDGSSSSSTANFFDGTIFELLMFNQAHTDEEIVKLNLIMQRKWQ